MYTHAFTHTCAHTHTHKASQVLSVISSFNNFRYMKCDKCVNTTNYDIKFFIII